MTKSVRPASDIWRPQGRFAATIISLRQLQVFNDRGGIAVNFDIMRSTAPDIVLAGSQNETFSLWETRSRSGFVTKPKFDARLVTVRFVTSGRIVYRRRSGNIEGVPSHATLVDFDDLREVDASGTFGAVSGTFAVDVLRAAHEALTGDPGGMPRLAPSAEMDLPGMRALFLTLKQSQQRMRGADLHDDLILPLLQEVMSYQLLSAWPRRETVRTAPAGDLPSRSLRNALDYIDANLSSPLTLADIAMAAGISVRSLQDNFRRELGQTPVQLILDRRLARAHGDLLAPHQGAASITEIARRWGFVHLGDFGQRYRRRYGCSPSETRREHGRTP